MTPTLFKSAMLTLPALCLSANVLAEEKEETKEAPVNLSNITAYRAANTPVNYSYIALNLGKNDYDNFSKKVTTAGLRGQVLLNEKFIFKMGYEGSMLDENDLGEELDYQSNLVNIGLGFRHPIFESTDLELDAHLLYNWDSNDLNDDENEELGYRVGAYINQGIGDSFEGTLGVNYSSEYQEGSTNLVLSITQYITEYVGVGLDGRFGSGSDDAFSGDQSYIGAHLRLAFY